MTAHRIGQTLRIVGPLLQVAALIGLFRSGATSALRGSCYATFLLGFVLVLAGVGLARAPRRARTGPLDLDR